MKFDELKTILKRLYKEYVRKHIKRILIALLLSIIVAASTSGIAWLLDPAVKKIFIEQNKVFAWSIPALIVIAFTSKGLSLYLAIINPVKASIIGVALITILPIFIFFSTRSSINLVAFLFSSLSF